MDIFIKRESSILRQWGIILKSAKRMEMFILFR